MDFFSNSSLAYNSIYSQANPPHWVQTLQKFLFSKDWNTLVLGADFILCTYLCCVIRLHSTEWLVLVQWLLPSFLSCFSFSRCFFVSLSSTSFTRSSSHSPQNIISLILFWFSSFTESHKTYFNIFHHLPTLPTLQTDIKDKFFKYVI